eukprot:Mrub_03197.p1 GENE.Mrub_03197~~Mrub_03197.p1  ORF type:complete len:480 (+),score=30.27 Mrub_03197:138-1442(+)
MQHRLCQVLTTIILVLIFQIICLISLELNIYTNTADSDNSYNIGAITQSMEELTKLNKLKPPFMFQFGTEYQGNGHDGKVEFPGAYYYDNYANLSTDLISVQKSYIDKGITDYSLDGFFPLVKYTEFTNSYSYYGEVRQIYPLVIRDSYDLNTIWENDRTLYDEYVEELIDSDFKQDKLSKTYWDVNEYPPLGTEPDPAPAVHYYYDFSSIEDEIDYIGHYEDSYNGNVKCYDLKDFNTDGQDDYYSYPSFTNSSSGYLYPGEGYTVKYDFTSTKEIYPGICNSYCKPSNGHKYYALYMGISGDYNPFDPGYNAYQCLCYNENPIDKLLTDKNYNQYSCLYSGKALVYKTNVYTQFYDGSIIIDTNSQNYYKLVQDYKNLIKNDVIIGDDNLSILKTYQNSEVRLGLYSSYTPQKTPLRRSFPHYILYYIKYFN